MSEMANARDVLAISKIACIDEPDSADLAWAREVFDRYRDAEHSGDCTKQAHTCGRCLVEDALSHADADLAALRASGFVVVPVEETIAGQHQRTLDAIGYGKTLVGKPKP